MWFLGAHIGLMVGMILLLLRIENRLGKGSSILDLIKQKCPIFTKGVCHGKTEMG